MPRSRSLICLGLSKALQKAKAEVDKLSVQQRFCNTSPLGRVSALTDSIDKRYDLHGA